jgi:nucleotide-binding universal stress UspA family protein
VLLGVGESPSFVGTGEIPASGHTLEHEERDAHEAMQRVVEEAGDGSLEYRELHGAVGPALAHACDGIDLLVTGSRGHGPFATVVAGSVSRHLAHHAPCPVLVVPRGVTGLHGTGPRTVSAA